MEDTVYGKSYLCRKCGFESLKAEFGYGIRCPHCGSRDVVNAKFWRRFSKIHKNQKGGRRN